MGWEIIRPQRPSWEDSSPSTVFAANDCGFLGLNMIQLTPPLPPQRHLDGFRNNAGLKSGMKGLACTSTAT